MAVIDNTAGAACRGLRCGAATAVSDVELVFLLGLPRRAAPPLRRVGCELAAGHEDSHIAFTLAADGGDRWWWVRWDARDQDLVQLEICDGVGQPDGDECMAPMGHPGPHSYEL